MLTPCVHFVFAVAGSNGSINHDIGHVFSLNGFSLSGFSAFSVGSLLSEFPVFSVRSISRGLGRILSFWELSAFLFPLLHVHSPDPPSHVAVVVGLVSGNMIMGSGFVSSWCGHSVIRWKLCEDKILRD